MFINIIPEFRHDQAVQRLIVASTSSNLSAVVDMLMLGISLEDISVPPAAAEYARWFAQHDLSLEALLRAYRLGEHTVLQRVIHDVSQRAMPADGALAVTRRIALRGAQLVGTRATCHPGHAGRSKARYSLAVTTASAGRVRISAGTAAT